MRSRCIADTTTTRATYHVANRRTDSHPQEVGYQLVTTIHRFRPYPPPVINGNDEHVNITLEWSTAAGRIPPVHPADRSLRITLRLTLAEARRLATELSRIS